MKVAHVWDGYGGTVFFEMGQLSESETIREDGTRGNPLGEITIGLEWGWCLIDQSKEICSSEDDEEICSSEDNEDVWLPILKEFVGSKISSLKLIGEPAEIELKFGSHMKILSIATDGDDPSWMIIDRRSKNIIEFGIMDGQLCH